MRLSRTAFERLLIEFLAEIYRTARVYVRRDQDAEDLVHEACVWALDRFDARAFPGPGACRQWLHQILLNVFRDSYRCAGRSPISDVTSLDNVVELIPSSGPGPEESAPFRSFAIDANRAFTTLPDEMRTVVALALVEGFSYAEIAQITDAPIGTVMSRLARGRAKLRQALHPYSSTKDSSGAHGHCGRNGMAM